MEKELKDKTKEILKIVNDTPYYEWIKISNFIEQMYQTLNSKNTLNQIKDIENILDRF